MIKTAFFAISNDISEDEIKKEAISIPHFLCEKNISYIDNIMKKKHRLSAYKSIVALKLLGNLIEDLRITPKIAKTEYGRPYFENTPSLDFNISHSDSMVVCALCSSHDIPPHIGVDCEQIYKKDPLPFAERFFTAKECKYILNAHDRQYAFTELWTKKEAYLKCLGKGLAMPLDSFDIFETGLFFDTFEKENNIVTLCYDSRIK